MDQDFRKKTFRGANMEDIFLELKKLEQLCEEEAAKTEKLEQKRFYEGMAIAYTMIEQKLKGNSDYMEPKVISQLYNSVVKTESEPAAPAGHTETCSFCQKNTSEAGVLAIGPGASICEGCLEFGKEVIKSQSQEI